MNCFKKKFILSFLIFLPVTAFAVNETPTQKKMIDKIAAVVNQDVILFSEYDTFRKKMAEEFQKIPEKKDELKNTAEFDSKALQQMIEDRLLEQEVKSQGLEATDSQLENVIDEVMKSNGLKNRKDLDRALHTEGLTYEEFTADYKKRISRSNLVNQIIRPKIKISDDEVATEIKRRTQSSVQETQYQVGMIFISKTNVSAKEIQKLRKSIRSQIDFANVANEKTEGPGKGKGGLMEDWVNPEDLQPALGSAVRKMKKGEVSPLIETGAGYYILACLDTRSKASAEQTKVKEEVQDDLMNTLLTKNLNQYILDLKKKAHIETFL